MCNKRGKNEPSSWKKKKRQQQQESKLPTHKLILHLGNKTIVTEGTMIISSTKTTRIDSTKEQQTPAMGLLADGEIGLDTRSNTVAATATAIEDTTEWQTRTIIQPTLTWMPLGRKKKTSDSRRPLASTSRNTLRDKPLTESSRKKSAGSDSKRKKRVRRMPTKRSERWSETRNAKKRHSGKKRETSGRNHRVVDREPESAGLARTVVAAVVVVVVVVVAEVVAAVAAEATADHRRRDRFRLRPLPTAVAPRDHHRRTAVVPLKEGRRSAAQGKIPIGIAAGAGTGNNLNEKENRRAVVVVAAAAEV